MREQKGAKVVGKKIGLTSKVMQNMLGVNRPDYGHILNDMIYKEEEIIKLSNYISPKVEFEIAFILKKEIASESVNVNNILESIDYVVPAIEIIDSRISDWKIKFEDTVADNGSSAAVILGKNKMKLDNLDLVNLKAEIYKFNEKIDEGYGSAVLGNPLEAIVWLAKSLHEYDIKLNEGEIILSGALTKALEVSEGDEFTAKFEHLGETKVKFSK